MITGLGRIGKYYIQLCQGKIILASDPSIHATFTLPTRVVVAKFSFSEISRAMKLTFCCCCCLCFLSSIQPLEIISQSQPNTVTLYQSYLFKDQSAMKFPCKDIF